MRLFLIGLFLLFSLTIAAQGWIPAGARSMSMANASATFYDVWSYHHNPAGLAKVETFSVGVSYENRFLLKELQSQALAAAIPLKVGVISVGGSVYGYNRFRSYKGGLGYSMKLAEKLAAGVQLNYQGISLNSPYGSKGAMTAEAGLRAEFTEKWSMGVAVFNIGRAKLAEFEDDRFSTVMRLGTAYAFSKKLLISLEAEKDLEHTLRVKSGVEYQVIDNLYFRGGVASAPIELSFGLGYKAGQFGIDFGSAYHQVLGWSPHFSLQFQGK